MQLTSSSTFREQLVDRRRRLESAAVAERADGGEIARLLEQVDHALAKFEDGSYGVCETCREPIEAERLIADPLVRFCLDHLTAAEQRALEEDLHLAARIQRGLLPKADVAPAGWDVAFAYRPAGLVSGDYCDVIPAEEGAFYFVLGDVAGKGVGASMLMAHLHAMVRTLISLRLPLGDIVERASRVFCESTLPTHYATLVTGRASATGEVELCNAGHPPPFLLSGGRVTSLDATGLPIGVFRDERFTTVRAALAPGDALLLYSDGASEARDRAGAEYGRDRLARVLAGCPPGCPATDMVGACLDDVKTFARGTATTDDLTIMVVRRGDEVGG